MATVKVKLRPSSVEGKAGVIYYQITHNRKTQQITTRLRVCPSDWNADEEKLVASASNRSMIQNRIDSDVALLRRVILDLDNCGEDYSVCDIINRYKSPQSHILVLDYIHTQVEQLRATNRLGTAKNYEKTMSSFGEFLGDVRLPLSALTEQVITDYNSFLIQRGLVRNSVSFYMRILRAVSLTIDQKVCRQFLHVVKPQCGRISSPEIANRNPGKLLLLHGVDPDIFRNIHTDLVNFESPVGIFGINLLQFGVDGVAVSQFGRPEIHQHDLSLQRTQTHFAAEHIGQLDIGKIRFGDIRHQILPRIHAGDLTGQQRQVGRLRITLLDGFRHHAVVNHISVEVEKVSFARKPLGQGFS